MIYRHDASANANVDRRASELDAVSQAVPVWGRVVLGIIGSVLWLGIGAMAYFVLVVSGALFTPGYGWVSILALVVWLLPLSLLWRWALVPHQVANPESKF
ncbi:MULTISPECIES: hypothetical protein [unclassified Sphingomonas]|uniref:hypothetical protein n=1 Tax=unclassified Sphingomonas TaxID=196159 RepID=UPI002150C4D8|nr:MULTISPECIES: hypothetical protein [unclassified Sphingomonas]MCR5872434.1 hypothetical protein [Sphingomonas sp. J344]UUX99284.1 hypothetical protein LRS08_17740 [Sphingomonas sp. J315]